MMPAADALWGRYRSTGDTAARSQLLDRYLGLVHHSAHRMARRVPREIELHDLIGVGTLGLVQALEGFDPHRGLAFSTYAMPRIRGAMLDEMRSRDWMPRSVRARSRQLGAARTGLQQKLGRQPSHDELAAALEVDLTTLWHWLDESEGRFLVPFDGGTDSGSGSGGSEGIADVHASDPGDAFDDAETLGQLRAALDGLPERDRLVLTLYFYEELNLREIGAVLEVSESRVSQIRTRALRRLRELVEPAAAAA